jgi:hypothetical protein
MPSGMPQAQQSESAFRRCGKLGIGDDPTMSLVHPIRRWRHLRFCALLCLASPVIAGAQTQPPPPPAKPPQAAPAPVKKKPTVQHTSTSASAHTSSHTSVSTSARTSAQKSKSSRGKKTAKKRGQQAIDSARAREIQAALIREHYLQGEPTGAYDASTQAAMKRYQQDHGWQSITTPDSRALIKLGLGPSHDRLLNPETAMTSTTTTTPKTTTTLPAAPPAADPKPAANPTQPDNPPAKN